MKLSTIFMLLMAFEFSLLLYNIRTDDTAIFRFIQNPTNWSDTSFLALIGGITLGLSALGLYIGSFVFKQDLSVFAGVTAIFITWLIPIASLWNLIDENMRSIGGDFSWVLASIICAPIVLLAIFSVIGWWRGNSEL